MCLAIKQNRKDANDSQHPKMSDAVKIAKIHITKHVLILRKFETKSRLFAYVRTLTGLMQGLVAMIGLTGRMRTQLGS